MLLVAEELGDLLGGLDAWSAPSREKWIDRDEA
jgi:hypothetical protein